MTINRAGFLRRSFVIGIAGSKFKVSRPRALAKILPWVVVGYSLVWPNPSSAFYDDLCFASQGAKWTIANCLANSSPYCSITNDCVPASCGANPASEKNLTCNEPVEKSFPNGEQDSLYHPRSMIHADSVYLLAQAVGLDGRAAYFIAAYGDTPDRAGGQFILMVSASGGGYTPYEDPLHATIALPDLFRGSALGSAIHFPLFTGNPRKIVPDSIHEGISRLRSWALGDGSGNFPTPCLGGLTFPSRPDLSYFQGDKCYVSSSDYSFEGGAYHINQSPNVSISITIPGGASSETSFQSGDQPFSGPSSKPFSATDKTEFADDLQGLLNGSPAKFDGVHPVPLALLKIGVYLHSLMDRVSHAPVLTPLTVPTTSSSSNFTGAIDWIIPHSYLHFEEVGIPTLSSRTETALSLAYDELALFAKQNPEFMAPHPVITAKSKVVPALVNSVLNQRSAAARLSSLEKLSQTLGYYPLTQPEPIVAPPSRPVRPGCGRTESGSDTCQ
jgi:hypothetical protein